MLQGAYPGASGGGDGFLSAGKKASSANDLRRCFGGERERDEEAKITKRMFCFCSVAPPLGTNLLLLLFYEERLVFHFLLSLSWSFALLNAFVVLRLSFFFIRQILPVHTVAAVASHFPLLVQAQNAAPDVTKSRPRSALVTYRKNVEDR